MHPKTMHYATIRPMPTNLHVRDVPDAVHATLTERAERHGMSLRQYTIQVLEEHCTLPTVDEWLDEVAALPPVEGVPPAAEALRRAREEDDAGVLGARRGA
ncbi:MAG: FitA-like ribbon-helix-helix domain-containing protein [Thermoanaerobaculia bacterium]